MSYERIRIQTTTLLQQNSGEQYTAQDKLNKQENQ